MGIGADSPIQQDLFDINAEQIQKMKRLDEVIDRINTMQETNGELNKSLSKLTAQNTQAAKDLNDGGYKTSNGKLWHKSFFSIESKTSSKTDTSNDKCWYLS